MNDKIMFKSAKPHRIVAQIGNTALIEYFFKNPSEKKVICREKYQLMILGRQAHKKVGSFTRTGVFTPYHNAYPDREIVDGFAKIIQSIYLNK